MASWAKRGLDLSLTGFDEFELGELFAERTQGRTDRPIPAVRGDMTEPLESTQSDSAIKMELRFADTSPFARVLAEVGYSLIGGAGSALLADFGSSSYSVPVANRYMRSPKLLFLAGHGPLMAPALGPRMIQAVLWAADLFASYPPK